MIAFDVNGANPSHAPSVKSLGIFSQITGSRADEIIIDDAEVSNNSDTEDKREKLIKILSEVEAILSPGGTITFLGTPQSEESIYTKLAQKGYKPLIIPVRYPELSQIPKYNGYLAPFILDKLEADPTIIGKSTDPRRFTDSDLMDREAAYGRSGFQLQFMLDTQLSDRERYPLKTSDLIVFGTDKLKAPINISWCNDPMKQIKDIDNLGFSGDRLYRPLFIDDTWKDYEGSIMFIDPSGKGTDQTAYAIVKQLHGKLYVLDCDGYTDGYTEGVLKALALKAKEYQVKLILVEPNYGGGMFNQVLTPILGKYYPCAIQDAEWVNTQKERRIIDTLEPLLNQHRIIFDESLVKKESTNLGDAKYSLLYQLTHITKDRGSLRHDDKLDALAGACSYWVNSMARDTQKSAKEYETRVILDSLKEHMDTMIKIKSRGMLNSMLKKNNTWI